ncbi:MAG: diguanylate cyclase [Rubrivivax sp.]|nr:diguanylate cyclase [Rubrivivax sp.]
MPENDATTLRLAKGQVSLFQALLEGGRADEARQPCLVLYSGADVGRRFVLPEGTLVVGRAPGCELQIDSAAISRRHAELTVQGDQVWLRDLGSANGSHLNDRRVEGSVQLRDADVVRLADVVLKFYAADNLDALLHDRIWRLAAIDAGTEVFSRRFLLDALDRELRLAQRHKRALSLVCFDLDSFKAVNDRWGHNTGDQVLRETAGVVRGVIRGTDLLGRLGGEEFAVVLPETALGAAIELAERMRSAVAEHDVPVPGPGGSMTSHRQTISLGVAQLSDQMQGVRDLLEAADRRLYAAKAGGRDRVCA